MTTNIASAQNPTLADYFIHSLTINDDDTLIVDNKKMTVMLHQAMQTIHRLETDLLTTQTKLGKKNEYILALQTLLTTDELTFITNRRGFFDHFEHEMDRVNRDLSKGGLLIMVDLDNFKMINDTYGHDAGDEALKLVAKTLNEDVRKMDCVARLGGDEFVILLANAQQSTLLNRAQKLARKLNRLTLKYNGHRISIKASLGMKPYDKGDNVKSILGEADKAMYDNKQENKTK